MVVASCTTSEAKIYTHIYIYIFRYKLNCIDSTRGESQSVMKYLGHLEGIVHTRPFRLGVHVAVR